MWLKLKKYDTFTSGLFSLDEQLHKMWGAWRDSDNAAAESYARDVMRGKPFPEYLRQSALAPAIEEYIGLLSVERVNVYLDMEKNEEPHK